MCQISSSYPAQAKPSLSIVQPSIVNSLGSYCSNMPDIATFMPRSLFPPRRRYNARGFDLNRNFPDYFKQNNKKNQPEAEAVKQWISKIQFVLSANLHGGALVASYPFDNSPNTSTYPWRLLSSSDVNLD